MTFQKGHTYNNGRRLPDEHRKQISQALKSYYKNTAGARSRISQRLRRAYEEGTIIPWNLNKKMSKEFRRNVSVAHRGLKYHNRKWHALTEEHKEHISKAIKKWWSKPENKKRMLKARSKTTKRKWEYVCSLV